MKSPLVEKTRRVPTHAEEVQRYASMDITRIRNCYGGAADMLGALVEYKLEYRQIGLQYSKLMLERTGLFEHGTAWEQAFDTETRAMLHNLHTQTCSSRAFAKIQDCDERLLRVYTDASEVLLLTAYLNKQYRDDGRKYALYLLELAWQVEMYSGFDAVFDTEARATLKKLRTSYNEAKAVRGEEIDNPIPNYPPKKGEQP
jgi:hypothetical protein